MQQVQQWSRIPIDVSSAQERAARIMQLVLDGASIPSMQRTRYKRWRDRSAQPSWFARGLASIRDLNALGVSTASMRRIPLAFTAAIDDLSGTPAPVTVAMVTHEMGLELTENVAATRALVEDTPEAHDAAAEALEAEVAAQLERIRAHRARAEDLRRRMR